MLLLHGKGLQGEEKNKVKIILLKTDLAIEISVLGKVYSE